MNTPPPTSASPARATLAQAFPAQTPAAQTPGFLEYITSWDWAPFVITVAVILTLLILTDRVLLRRTLSTDQRMPRQIAMLVLTVFAIVGVVLALPASAPGKPGMITEETRANLLALIGLGVTALITLSSTTLAANGMSGLMLRATAPFKGGDWIRVADHFGRVTERGLFHTEIQTEDRDLLSLPNLFLATNPLRIVRKTGTVISAEASLGYDVDHTHAESLLILAAERAGLDKPFVWIIDLKDHAVVYRVAGILEDVTGLISVRSRLRACVLDTLHEHSVEIASPGIVIQRQTSTDHSSIPPVKHRTTSSRDDNAHAETEVFDKAEQVQRHEDLVAERDRIESRLKELNDDPSRADNPDIDAEIRRREQQLAHLQALIEHSAKDKTSDE